MKVLVLTPSLYDTSPGLRFRIEQWARHLAQDGLEFTFVPFADAALHRVIYERGCYVRKAALMSRALLRRFGVLGTVRNYDAVFLYREAALMGPAVIERLIARQGVPIIYDFDDPIWLAYRSPMNRFFSRLKFQGKTAKICGLATAVIVGNELLAGWARQHSRQVYVVPSTIDMDSYPMPPPAHAARSPATLGWTGSHSTIPFLGLVHDTLRRLAAKHRFRLLVISHSDRYAAGSLSVEVEARRWNARTEAADLLGMDIGLGPFPDTGWTPWRCHGKVLQYMAAGIPAVASRIGIMPEYIRDGVNGFLAQTEDEWLEKLAGLIEEPVLRRRTGLAARETIEQRYSARVWAPRVREILETAVGGRSRCQN